MTYTTTVNFNSVMIIESLPSEDLRTGRELFELAIIPGRTAKPDLLAEFYEPKTAADFHATLKTIEAATARYGLSPILHLKPNHGCLGAAAQRIRIDIGAYMPIVKKLAT
jgi:hypothetical protein